ncbi:PDZ domain-containing protein [Microbacterium sp. SORGH_AS_0888]|uniref:YlbL family protein n=1 Tax=Microbacterium sp. SORGH_AS_0888 TaxID=3041791 RepID=UPI00278187AD|nr:S16 family serine protease [Microbacterium sp. SORGH_AS_0888]MDQ1128205.1 PDZ domain-containing protein [Microbacterium sp. SORGH_AS_0888]
MTLFDDAPHAPEPRTRRAPSRGVVVGAWSLVVALLCLLGLSFLPTAYVIEQPGPVYNTIGDVTGADGSEVPLLKIDGTQTYDPSGALNLLTVQVVGSPERPTSWLQIVSAWFDRTRAVVPMEAVFPSGQTSDQRSQQNAEMMTDSQVDAEAAAFRHLGYDVKPTLAVTSVSDDAAAKGLLAPGDEILSVDGQRLTSADALRAAVAASAGAAMTFEIDRDGAQQTVSVTPAAVGDGKWLLGVTAQQSYEIPYEVTFGLTNVGGPSAGMMFALGIIDTVTPDDLTGGHDVAGTGTITAEGTVGAIGGIRQKMWGAADAGAQYFLAPRSNCDEVVGHVPPGLRVFAVSTLDDALTALQAIAHDGDLDALPTCSAG